MPASPKFTSAASPTSKAASSRSVIAIATQAVPSAVAPALRKASRHLPALTGLRFVLALWVILHHLTGRGQMLEPAALALPGPLYALIRGGYLAVTTFFVLSGFVLSRSYAETRWNRGSLLGYADRPRRPRLSRLSP